MHKRNIVLRFVWLHLPVNLEEGKKRDDSCLRGLLAARRRRWDVSCTYSCCSPMLLGIPSTFDIEGDNSREERDAAVHIVICVGCV